MPRRWCHADPMRVLFLTHRLPYAPNRGDRIRAYHILKALRTFAEVDLFSLVHDAREASHVKDLRQLGVDVTALPVSRRRNLLRGGVALLARLSLTHELLNPPAMNAELREISVRRPPDVVLAYCSGMARVAVNGPLARRPFVLDLVDVDSQKWAELAARSSPPL